MTNFESEYQRRRRIKAERDRDKAAEVARTDKVAGAIRQLEEKLDRLVDENTPLKKRERRWRHAEVFGLWAAAGVGAIGSHDAGRQRNVMEGQLSIMKAQISPRLDMQINQEVVKDKNGANVGWYITPHWTNRGQGDAIQVEGFDGAKNFTAREAAQFDFRSGAKGVSTTIVPGGGILQSSQFISLDDLKKIDNHGNDFVIWGMLSYRDPYPNTPLHHRYWCNKVAVAVTNGATIELNFPLYKTNCNYSD